MLVSILLFSCQMLSREVYNYRCFVNLFKHRSVAIPAFKLLDASYWDIDYNVKWTVAVEVN